MFIDLESLFWLTFIVLGMLHWWKAQRVKEIALGYTRRKCKELELQLLDDSINLRGFWFKRDEKGQLRIWRSYNFEFSSTGEERYRGRVVTLGQSVISFILPPYRVNDEIH